MNRCTPRLALSLLASIALIYSHAESGLAAYAQNSNVKASVRAFPPTALRGEMAVKNHPEIVLNGRAERLSPGARIWDQNSALVLSGALVGQLVNVNYVREANGLVHQVWILNSEELKEKRAGSNATVFNFTTLGDAPNAP